MSRSTDRSAPTTPALRAARRARVARRDGARTTSTSSSLGREANVRYVVGRAVGSGPPASRPFGPGCVLVRATREIYLLSTWDEGVPDDIPHDHLYGISLNPMNFVDGARGHRRRRDGPHASAPTPCRRCSAPAARRWRFPDAELVDGEQLLRRARRIKTPEEVDAIRAPIGVAERALAAAVAALRPGVSERAAHRRVHGRDGVARASPPRRPRTSRGSPRAQQPWQRSSRDAPVGRRRPRRVRRRRRRRRLRRRGRAGPSSVGEPTPSDVGACSAAATSCWDRLLDACRPGRAGERSARRLRTRPATPRRRCRSPAGLGLGFDVPLVTHDAARTAAERAAGARHGPRPDGVRLATHGVGAVIRAPARPHHRPTAPSCCRRSPF